MKAGCLESGSRGEKQDVEDVFNDPCNTRGGKFQISNLQCCVMCRNVKGGSVTGQSHQVAASSWNWGV